MTFNLMKKPYANVFTQTAKWKNPQHKIRVFPRVKYHTSKKETLNPSQ